MPPRPKRDCRRSCRASATGSAGFIDALAQIKAKQYAAAYAAAASLGDIERRAIQWAAICFGGGGEIAAGSVRAFEADAPGFVNAGVFKTRLEQAVVKAAPAPADLIKYLGGAMPNTIDAQIRLAAAYVADGQPRRATAIARAIWVEDFLDAATETRILANFGELLTPDDHWARAMHLMMHDRATATERLFKFGDARAEIARRRAQRQVAQCQERQGAAR